jgi:hypothetical protein
VPLGQRSRLVPHVDQRIRLAGRDTLAGSVRVDNRSLTVAAQNQRFRAARASKRYAGQQTRTDEGQAAVGNLRHHALRFD